MQDTEVVIVGGGQAGLAMSRCLRDLGIDHVVLERRRVAERWRSERWDSLRLLTPNWMTRLPGWSYPGADPDGFMTAAALAEMLEGYARSFGAPVLTDTAVRSVAAFGQRLEVRTERGDFRARDVVLATGQCDQPIVPTIASYVSRRVHQITPASYKNPNALPPGGVMVVGAAASGVQIANELALAGRQVALAVGRHLRLPRVHRGRDIYWWMEEMRLLDEPTRPTDLPRPSPQLMGRDDHRAIDLPVLQRAGVQLFGRLVAADGEHLTFADDLAASVADADERLARLVHRIETFAAEHHLTTGEPSSIDRLRATGHAPHLDLARRGIGTIVWATGFRASFDFLDRGLLERGGIVQAGAVPPFPGLHVLGMRHQRRRKSSLIDGVGDDARQLAARIASRRKTLRGKAA